MGKYLHLLIFGYKKRLSFFRQAIPALRRFLWGIGCDLIAQTAVTAVWSVTLNSGQYTYTAQIPNSPADGGFRQFQLLCYGGNGRPTFPFGIGSVAKVKIHRNGSVRQFAPV